MRRVVLDTNCLLQLLPSRSPYHKIWTEILSGHIIQQIDWPKLTIIALKDFYETLK